MDIVWHATAFDKPVVDPWIGKPLRRLTRHGWDRVFSCPHSGRQKLRIILDISPYHIVVLYSPHLGYVTIIVSSARYSMFLIRSRSSLGNIPARTMPSYSYSLQMNPFLFLDSDMLRTTVCSQWWFSGREKVTSL